MTGRVIVVAVYGKDREADVVVGVFIVDTLRAGEIDGLVAEDLHHARAVTCPPMVHTSFVSE